MRTHNACIITCLRGNAGKGNRRPFLSSRGNWILFGSMPCSNVAQLIFLSDVSELQQWIDASELPTQYGGTNT